MGWKAEANKIYEERVVADALARLASRIDLTQLPFSDDEVKTLARRSRQSFLSSKKKKEAYSRYLAALAKTHGTDPVLRIAAVLEDIQNEIGFEEK